jgi:hypothetical protein
LSGLAQRNLLVAEAKQIEALALLRLLIAHPECRTYPEYRHAMLPALIELECVLRGGPEAEGWVREYMSLHNESDPDAGSLRICTALAEAHDRRGESTAAVGRARQALHVCGRIYRALQDSADAETFAAAQAGRVARLCSIVQQNGGDGQEFTADILFPPPARVRDAEVTAKLSRLARQHRLGLVLTFSNLIGAIACLAAVVIVFPPVDSTLFRLLVSGMSALATCGALGLFAALVLRVLWWVMPAHRQNFNSWALVWGCLGPLLWIGAYLSMGSMLR